MQEEKIFYRIKGLINNTDKYKFITVICCLATVILTCVIIVKFSTYNIKIDSIEKQIKSLEQDNKDLNFEVGKAQGIAIKNED